MEDPDHAMEEDRAVTGPGSSEPDVTPVVSLVLNARHRVPPTRALLVGISGIDGSGKGYVAARIAERLGAAGVAAVVLHADDWLNLPRVRFSDQEPGRHFYHHALRLEEMFERLVLPLQETRSVDVEADHAEETATEFLRRRHVHRDVDVILVEGIFLFQQPYLTHFDATIWVDCSFQTALQRAIARGQEGLPPDQTIAAFQRIYFPAQRIHFDLDAPRRSAGMSVRNDPAPPDPNRRHAPK